jgi:hypothetical protein
MSDPASTYARLKAETAAMLGVDPADMSKMEGLRLDITSLRFASRLDLSQRAG